ncbi:MAG: prepilin-type N-terminal cleavage/methylation domain-containing protein [bacterium]|nr:prepilin-type N-terminal cleavage/methylation domain-containing protein [bacterium]
MLQFNSELFKGLIFMRINVNLRIKNSRHSHVFADSHRRGGFTLIELLIVIAIVSALSVVVVLALNPAQLLKQARDSNRASDLSTLKMTVSLYLSDVSGPNIAVASLGYTSCYLSTIINNGTGTAKCGVFVSSYLTGNNGSTSALFNKKVNGTGWLPVNFTQISIGSPVGGAMPTDPVNNATYYYAYAASGTSLTFELNAFMESDKYGSGGPKDVETKDGGDNGQTLESGSAPGLAL